MAKRTTATILLDIDKLDEVICELRYYKFPEVKWFELGLQLGVQYTALSAIEAAHGSTVNRALMECLTKWLRNEDVKPTAGPFTWQRLVKALNVIKENAIAEKINKTMVGSGSQLLQQYSDRLSQVVLTERTVQMLHTEGMISKETAIEVERCGGSLACDSLREVYFAVTEDHKKLMLFANVLMNTDDAVFLANEIIKEYEKTFTLPIKVPVKSQLSTESSDTSTESGTAADTTEISGNLEISIHRHELKIFDEMRNIYGCFLHGIAPLIEAKIPSLDNFKVLLRRLRPEIKSQLKLAETFDNIMEVIEEKCSIINITLLECIVDQYSIDKAKECIRNYNEKLNEFCNHENSLRICHNLELKTMSASHLVCESIKFILNWEIDEHTLSDIRDLLTKSFSSMANRVEVVVIKEGNSITVTCYAPHYLMESLLVIAKGNLDTLKKEFQLISLTIGYYTVYDQRAIDEEVKIAAEERISSLTLEQNEPIGELLESSETQYRMTRKRTLEVEISETTSAKKVPDPQLTDREEVIIKSDTSSEEKERLLQVQKEINQKMKMEIDHLRLSLRSKKELENELAESKEEKASLQEKVSEMSKQLSIGYTSSPKIHVDRSTQSEQVLISQLESLQLFQFAMTDQSVADISRIADIRSDTNSNDYKAVLFLEAIEEDPFLLAELKHIKQGEKTGTVEWASDSGVWLVSPSPRQCQQVISQLNSSPTWVRIERTYPDLVSLVVPLLLQQPVVTELSIVYTMLNPQTISALPLSTNTTLITLYLCYSSMTDNEVASLASVLSQNSTLTQLYLSSNSDITDASAIFLSNILSQNNLTLLSLWGTSLTSDGVRLLLNSLINNTILKTLKLDKKHESFCHSFTNYKQIEKVLSFV